MGIGDYIDTDNGRLRNDKKDEFLDYIVALENNLDKAEHMRAHHDADLAHFLLQIEVLQKEAEDFAQEIGRPSQALTDTRNRLLKLQTE